MPPHLSTGSAEVHHHIQFLHGCLRQNPVLKARKASTYPLSHLPSPWRFLQNFTLYFFYVPFHFLFLPFLFSPSPLTSHLPSHPSVSPFLISQCSVHPSKTLLFCLVSSLRCGYIGYPSLLVRGEDTQAEHHHGCWKALLS